jgi:hypothetical protein
LATSKKSTRSIVSLSLPKVVPALITYAEQIVKSMTNNPSFPTPSPTLASISQAIADLTSAEAAALSRAKGTALTRDDKRAALVKLLELLKAYVQSVADANDETAATVIQSAGLAVRKTPVRKPRVFSAKEGATSGSVKIVTASAGARSSYEWQYSTDGGKTWVFAPATTQGKTTVAGLPSGTTVQFRYLAVTPKGGQGDWSPAVSMLVK